MYSAHSYKLSLLNLPLRIDTEKLAKMQAKERTVGKGTVRRKVKKTAKSSAGELAKLQNALKKVNAQPIPAIEEVNMFREDGQVLHFAAPKVQASVAANTFVIGGGCQEKGIFLAYPTAILIEFNRDH